MCMNQTLNQPPQQLQLESKGNEIGTNKDWLSDFLKFHSTVPLQTCDIQDKTRTSLVEQWVQTSAVSPTANAGDKGSLPGPGRLYILESNYARVPQLLSLSSRTPELYTTNGPGLQLLKPVHLEPLLPHHNSKPTHHG